ncbi:MAG: CRISPR-associated endonuclease Cas1 [Candidatus Nanopelagicales bacterium]
MGALLHAAASEQALLNAWADIRESALADGEPHVAVERFEAAAAKNIARISQQLRTGTWQPSPVVHLEVAKSSGGRRHLGVPGLEDRIVERSILAVVDPLIDPILMPWSFAYRRGLGVDDAIRALVEARDLDYTWVVRCDIKDCFAQIPRWKVTEALSKVCDDPDLVHLVRDLVDRRLVGRNAPRLPRGRGLHQGSPLSPLLANLYLDGFDRAMADSGWQVLRFADDIAIPTRDRGDAEDALASASEAAASIDLELNLGKSEILSFDTGVDFLGQTVTASSGAGVEPSSHPFETMVYVTHQGAIIRTRGERLIVEHGEQTLMRLNLKRIRQVVLLGRIGMTTPFLRQALLRGIEVVLLEDDGEFVGRFTPQIRGTAHLRMMQYACAAKPARSLDLAKHFVMGKIQNMRVQLQRLDRRMEEPIFGPAIRRMDRARTNASEALTLPALMGCEGAATREYFQGWQRGLPAEWEFAGRVRRPPTDPINAMLSFGYTLLTQEGESAAEVAGLDPHVGFLHQAQLGRPALALDLIEEFRPVIVDQVVLTLVNRGAVQPADFQDDPERGCRLTPTARNVLVAAFERRILQLVTYQSGRRMSYRNALHMQAKSVAKVVSADADYRPLLWK